MKIKITELKNKIKSLFKNIPEEDKEIIADCLVWAEMTENKTQGIVKLMGPDQLQTIIPKSEVKIERETKVSALVKGGENPAMIVSKKAMDIAIQKAVDAGISIVGARNFFYSNGAQGYYLEQIAKHDLIGMMCSRSSGGVAAFGSIDPLFGTNPIGYAFPTNEDPIVFDAATSAMTFYGLGIAKSKGEQIPTGIAIDKDGNPTTNPEAAIAGSLLPFGNSYKASGFSMLVELLTGPLIGGAFLDYKTFDKEWGTTIIAINPSIFTDLKEFKKNCSEFVRVIRNSRTLTEIRMPHDKARQNYKESVKSGLVEVDDVIYNKIFG